MNKVLLFFMVMPFVLSIGHMVLRSEEDFVKKNSTTLDSRPLKETKNFKTSKPLTDYFDERELRIIKKAANRNNCKDQLFPLLLAIRKAENGKKGCEFGIVHPRAWNTNLDTQAGWCAATVVKNFERWSGNGISGDGSFIEFLGSRYAPIGAENDPDNLNKNWVQNVRFWYERLKDG